jgi:3-oxoadipate enol-lactonase
MKTTFKILILLIITINSYAQDMNKQIIKTSIGQIAVFTKTVENTTPIIFLHGVYFDHILWDYQINKITDRTVINVDMPLHGESNIEITKKWDLNDCADMLIEILDTLKVEKCIAIGHSWGSMTIVRASNIEPNRFQSIGLCNMPWESGKKRKAKFFFQHTMLGFRNFYTKQAAKSLFGKMNLRNNKNLLSDLKRPMSNLSNKNIRQIDREVIVNANDITELLKNLKINSMALIGKDDYLKTPPFLKSEIVKGGHISPLQADVEVSEFIRKVINL